jgi:hypothetical protein
MVDVATRPVSRPAFRLGRRARKITLLTHIAAAGAWLGIDVVLGVMVGTALVTGDAQQAGVALQSLGLFAVWPLIVVGLLCLGSGILLGVGSKYGLLRYWWVAIKLVLNVALVVLVLVLLRPQVGEVSESARASLLEATGPPAVGDLVFPPLVSGTVLLVAMALSVFKPWGTIRRGGWAPVTPQVRNAGGSDSAAAIGSPAARAREPFPG